jgi:Ca-activated chloride channel homolog
LPEHFILGPQIEVAPKRVSIQNNLSEDNTLWRNPMFPSIQFRPVAQMVSTSGRTLPILSTQVRATAQGGIASVLVTQLFENPYDEILSVTYSLPLPADAAVSGFAIVLQDRRVIGEVDRKAKAKERYQKALREGHSAALLDQERSSLFRQRVGNIPPRSNITVEILLDQRLLWLSEGAWEWRLPTMIAPRYQRAEPLRGDSSLGFSREALPASLWCSLLIEEQLSEEGVATSPSHEVTVQTAHQRTLVSLSRDERREQDLVVRWPVAAQAIGASLSTCRPELGGLDHFTFGLLTLLPPSIRLPSLPRDLILLLDVSGSMSGAPLQQMKEVSNALIATLSERDQLEVISFSTQAKSWRRSAVYASAAHKAEATQWVNALQANGGTEMKSGIIAALAPLRADAQRQVILMTDGLISAEDEIVAEIYHRLPKGSRVHTLGIGGSVNRSLTASVSRAGAGIEQLVALSESAEKAAQRLAASTDRPLVVGLRLGGSALIEASPSRLPDLYAGSPALLSLKLRPEGGELWVEGDTAQGFWMKSLQVAPLSPSQGEQAIAALYAREAAEDAEMSLAAGQPRKELKQQIEDLGIAFQISTRLTSWIAVSEEVTVDVSAPSKTAVIPQDLQAGMGAAAGFRTIRASLRQRTPRARSAPLRSAANTRNLGLMGHMDAGKTTLTERLLYQADLSAHDSEDQGFTMDWMEMERERGISIQPAVTSCQKGEYDLNLVNLPRYTTDFAAECIQSALEGVILVLDATASLEAKTTRRVKSMGVPCLAFINKLDRVGSDYVKALQQLAERLGRSPLLLQMPILAAETPEGVLNRASFANDTLEGIIDLVEMRACYFERELGTLIGEEAIPLSLREEAQQRRRELIEALADVDDTITEAFLASRELSSGQLKVAIRGACLARKAAPVFLGSAWRNQGIPLLLDGIIDYLPSPQDATYEALDQSKQRLTLTASAEKPFVGRAFVIEESFPSRLSYLRIYQGHLSKGEVLFNCTTQKKARPSRMMKVYARERPEVEEASAGDIISLSGVECAAGDTFTHGGVACTMSTAPLPEAILSIAITTKDKEERVSLESALSRFTREDPTLRVRPGKEPHQTIIAGTDELQLELLGERLRREYRWGGIIGEVQVEYTAGPEGGTLEPMMLVEVTAPIQLQGTILIQLDKRRGAITDSSFEESYMTFTAELSMVSLLGYRKELRDSTQGKGELRMRFLRYEPSRV